MIDHLLFVIDIFFFLLMIANIILNHLNVCLSKSDRIYKNHEAAGVRRVTEWRIHKCQRRSRWASHSRASSRDRIARGERKEFHVQRAASRMPAMAMDCSSPVIYAISHWRRSDYQPVVDVSHSFRDPLRYVAHPVENLDRKRRIQNDDRKIVSTTSEISTRRDSAIAHVFIQ